MNCFKSIGKAGMMALCLIACYSLNAQTDADALMMKKNVLCAGAVFQYSSWTDYWEGTFKRDNENLGNVSTRSYMVMGNYGISNRLNVLFSIPYVQTRASAGTLKGMNGIQDLAVMLKWMPLLKKWNNGQVLSAYAVGGVSAPLSDYAADYLPLSLGLHSRNAMVRGIVDYYRSHFFLTLSAAYTLRSNVTIDRNSYYTTEMHYTRKVDMPDAAGAQARAGFRNKTWVAEVVVDRMNTLGGFDIRKNDMPFPSNRMNASVAGVNLKYTVPAIKGLELLGGCKYTFAGRNVGQANTVYGGIFYILDFSGNQKVDVNLKTTVYAQR